MKEELKVGDRVLVKRLFGSIFHAHIIAIGRDILGKTYYARYGVHDHDYGIHYDSSGLFRSWNIIGKN